ncbi:MAG TPA: UDP-3-O-(3-hydroxymyristoyl)glucosamine N-acyltransferase [Flavobacteriales bacterium]|nr:UDP-3-O-(3-hydroxymyristoyl)glucosamine N-acyltransferase [Flavobacteriales bacterium]HIN39702.1 UDP-3-O-(3-hydroxymyristoyl)glucosamine N-acyltransferase [Flavobacteriales bacterium]
MKFTTAISVKDLAEMIQADIEGDENQMVIGINEIHKVSEGDLVFVDHPKYYEKALSSAATTILIDKKIDCPIGKTLLISDNPFRDYNKLTRHYCPFSSSKSQISSTAIVGERTTLQPNVVLGNHVVIGKHCIIHPNVSIYDNCVLGDNVIVHANTVIGGDAFYYQKQEGKYNKMHTCGRVVIADDVEIGSNSTIDKGVSGDTIIGKGTKIDNHVHVGHDTVIGKNCLFAAHVGISGAVIIEDDVTLWGQVGIPSDVTIGKGAVVLAQSGVTKSLESNKIYFGSPAAENREKLRELALIRKLPELMERL